MVQPFFHHFILLLLNKIIKNVFMEISIFSDPVVWKPVKEGYECKNFLYGDFQSSFKKWLSGGYKG